MWICQKCNRQNVGKFCVNCGVAINAQAANKMEFTKKRSFVGCFVVGCLLFMGIIFATMFIGSMRMKQTSRKFDEWREEQRKKRTAETVGKITDYTIHRSGSSSDHYAHYDFVVDGKTHSGKILVQNGSGMKFPKGKEGSVCYDPADLKNNTFSLKEENHKCGN